MIERTQPAVWFPAVQAGTGADVFTETLVTQLKQRGLQAEITWLPRRAEYMPWTVPAPKSPEWANIVHVNTWLHARFIPKRLPVVATLHHSIHCPPLEPYKGQVRSLYHRHWICAIERAAMRRAESVTAVSRFAAETARRFVLDRPMEVIPNGVDIGQFFPQPGRTPHNPFRLLYVGRWMALKGVDLLAPIMRELGDGFELRYTGEQTTNARRAGMPPNMRNIGRLTGAHAVATAMRNSDAFLFPSRSEGFGLVIAEAMACGLPVISTHGSSLTELIEDGITGILCPQDDVTAFVSAARSLVENPALALAMSVSARKSAEQYFSIDKMVEAYISIYGHRIRGL